MARPSDPTGATPTRLAETGELASPLVLAEDHVSSATPTAGTTAGPRGTPPGRRRAERGSAGRRHPVLRAVPSTPVLVGVATLAVAFGGAVMSTPGEAAILTSADSATLVHSTSVWTGTDGGGSVDLLGRTAAVSRDSSRQALAAAADSKLVAAAERQAQERNAALAQFAQQAEQQAARIAENQWVLPLDSYRLTAQFGDVGLWATYHTGLDFANDSGTPIHAVANGVVTSAGYDGSYGNKTVVTLDDGTELWYCHQTTFEVSVGDTVSAGQEIGTVGATGHVTGPHLHLEVRPGGGDPVDPYAALVIHGITP